MKERDVIYFRIWRRVIAKRVKNGEHYEDYLFKTGMWIRDEENIIENHLMEFESFEPKESPDQINNSDHLIKMVEISKEEAISIMNEEILNILKNDWKNRFKKKKEEWDKDPGWLSKLVSTDFKLNGKWYTIMPEDIGLTSDGWDQGFMETIQGEIEKDLEKYGATKVYNHGFID